jgi:hypothetical protein
MSLRTVLVAGLLAMTTLAHAASDHDRWVDHLEKYAVYVGGPEASSIVDALQGQVGMHLPGGGLAREAARLHHRR